MSLRDGNAQIYLTSADPNDPSHATPINLSHSKSNDQKPAWSPDGKQIAYASDRDGNQEICVMQADGTNQMCLTNNRTPNRKPDPKKPEDRSPVWSADGKHIAFVSTRDGTAQIYVMDYDGSNITNLTRNTWDNFEPAWSPDLKQMAYVSDRDGNLNICAIDASGFNQSCLTNNRTPNRKFDPNRPNERFKATVYILDTRLRADAINVAIFRQTQATGGAWTDATVDPDTALQIENAILTRARQLRLSTLTN